MRISERGMTRTILTDLMMNRSRLDRLHEQLSSGKRINRPSDDPGGTVTTMQINGALSELEQFRSNISLAAEWLNSTESVLAETSDVINRLRELSVRGATDTMSEAALGATAEEVSEITDHLLSLANTKHVGRYIFAGYRTDAEPFSLGATGFEYAGDHGAIMRQAGPGVEVQVNVPGDQGDGDGFFVDLLETASRIRDGLFAGDTAAVNDELDALDRSGEDILAIRAQVGSRVNRLQMSENRLEDMKISLTRTLSETADVDMAEALMELTLVERAYNVSLATGARILPQTLLDYLR